MAKSKKKTAKKTKKKTKKAAKRTVKPSNHIKVTVTKKVLGEAPEEHVFVLHDGRKLKSVYELIDELETMSEDTFKHHVDGIRNDFANWLNDVFDEKSLADEIKQVHERIETQHAIMKRLMRALKELEPPHNHKINHSSKCTIC